MGLLKRTMVLCTMQALCVFLCWMLQQIGTATRFSVLLPPLYISISVGNLREQIPTLADMESCIFAFGSLLILCFLTCNAANSNLFREYIGAESDSVKFTDVPINTSAEFHFILAFAIDYSHGKSPSPTNGNFNIFWETKHLGPSDVASIKSSQHNVKVALSLGGDTVSKHQYAYFQPTSISSWVSNAVSSLTLIINQYNLDGIDVDYEHFHAHNDPETFTECIGQLVATLKKKRIISFASIAPFDDGGLVQNHYLALWSKYGNIFDYVNFQFYAYNNRTSIQQFLGYIDEQTSNYNGGKVLASFISEGSGGLGPKDGFFEACKQLKKEGKLKGIFVWCADGSKKMGFLFEKQAQELLVST